MILSCAGITPCQLYALVRQQRTNWLWSRFQCKQCVGRLTFHRQPRSTFDCAAETRRCFSCGTQKRGEQGFRGNSPRNVIFVYNNLWHNCATHSLTYTFTQWRRRSFLRCIRYSRLIAKRENANTQYIRVRALYPFPVYFSFFSFFFNYKRCDLPNDMFAG